MRLLLEGGADPTLRTATGAQALMFAAGAARGKPVPDAMRRSRCA